MGRHHNAAWSFDADCPRWFSRVRARAYPSAHNRRQSARKGSWRKIRAANCSHTAPAPGSRPEACAGRSTGRRRANVQCESGHDLKACSSLTAIFVTQAAKSQATEAADPARGPRQGKQGVRRCSCERRLMREAPPPHSIILIDLKPLRSITNRLKTGDERIVRLDCLRYGIIVRFSHTD